MGRKVLKTHGAWQIKEENGESKRNPWSSALAELLQVFQGGYKHSRAVESTAFSQENVV